MNWWENTGWIEYINKEWGFRISYPSLLRLYVDRGSRTLFISRQFLSNNKDAKNCGAVIVGFDSNIEKGTTLDKFTEIKEARKVSRSHTLLSVKKIMISNDTIEAREIVTQTEQPEYTRIFDVFTIRDDYWYTIMWFIMETELEKELGFFKTTVKSFVFI